MGGIYEVESSDTALLIINFAILVICLDQFFFKLRGSEEITSKDQIFINFDV